MTAVSRLQGVADSLRDAIHHAETALEGGIAVERRNLAELATGCRHLLGQAEAMLRANEEIELPDV